MNSKIQSLLESANSHDANSSVSFDKRVFPDAEKARSAFSKLKTNLLNINEWNQHSALSSFELFDENGSILSNKTIFESALCRIYLKGSGKYDWVKFIEVYDSTDEIVISVTPTYNPTAENPDKSLTSHFFTSESVNNFCLMKNDISVSLYVIGLNEKQNTTETKNQIETVRNVITANAGSYLGIQQAEWDTFCKNFLASID